MVEEHLEVTLVREIVEKIVSKPSEVRIHREVDDIGTRLDLEVDKSDLGVVIGKEGKTVQAIRVLLRAIGARTQQKISLRVIE